MALLRGPPILGTRMLHAGWTLALPRRGKYLWIAQASPVANSLQDLEPAFGSRNSVLGGSQMTADRSSDDNRTNKRRTNRNLLVTRGPQPWRQAYRFGRVTAHDITLGSDYGANDEPRN